MSRALTQTELLVELEPVVEENLNRHLGVAKEWFPHEYIPYDEARTYDGVLGGEAWSPEHSAIPEAARVSLVVNLLTEDNLPSYHHEIATTFGRDGAWGTWVHRWTAEEGRHAVVIRDYLMASRAVDPIALERARMAHMENGFATEYGTMLQQLAYVSFQELATRIAHRNTGRVSGDPDCERILARVAADENLHMLFYRNLLGAAFELSPSQTMRAVTDVVTSFQMPGAGMQGFARKSMAIAHAGIYDLRLHCDEVLAPVLRQWKVNEIQGLDAEGEKAREELDTFMTQLDLTATRFEERREARRAREAAGA
ncbi:acyl-ACP desaturase [Acrocarpospora phusangensis]|uniref:Acyl-ACP desaturase n=1 Tax=Acrocarpospora phusangensis TaxID=1070424 RepID=A0A919QAF8_9ACTN|nr:acyl-ACP desaturase [Acrocarpospora phusangensis]GIH24426.1 acyl-ACP desaturase [Acrocarpospora phusangensis]